MNLTGYTLVYTPVEIVKNEAEQNTKKINKIVTIKQQRNSTKDKLCNRLVVIL
jgi:hypothetical protein